jgi:hypothetical protein
MKYPSLPTVGSSIADRHYCIPSKQQQQEQQETSQYMLGHARSQQSHLHHHSYVDIVGWLMYELERRCWCCLLAFESAAA